LKKKRVLVVEDEAAIRRGVVDALTLSGYEILEAADGAEGLRLGRSAEVDLVLLDLLMPRMDGLQVLSELRKTSPALPIIILTARGGEEDRVRGLRGGADDYVIKPFSARELLARVEAVLRRTPGRPENVPVLTGPSGTVNLARREFVDADGGRKRLSEMEASILQYLAAHHQRAVSRDELLTSVWGIGGGSADTRAIDMHVTRLRGKLGSESHSGEWIATVRGQGYMLSANVSRAEGEAE